ncbi:MAG: hypothetical protein ACX939_01510 [Hyphococcus sp.]
MAITAHSILSEQKSDDGVNDKAGNNSDPHLPASGIARRLGVGKRSSGKIFQY